MIARFEQALRELAGAAALDLASLITAEALRYDPKDRTFRQGALDITRALRSLQSYEPGYVAAVAARLK